jgi:tetratricopeptide (TPR) repeat protein
LLLVMLGVSGVAGEARAQEALRFEQGADRVRALAGAEERWSFRTPELRRGEKAVPIQVGETVVFCAGGQLYEAAASTGKIQRRLLLPGACAALSNTPGGYEVRCEGGPETQRWQRAFPLSPGQGGLATVLPSETSILFGTRRQAEAIAGKSAAEQQGAPERLEQQRLQDPTNPWYAARRAELLLEQGKAAEARGAAAQALEIDPRYDLDLLPLAARLHKIAPELGPVAFDRGMKNLLLRGYEPTQATSALAPMTLLGRPGDQAGSEPMDPVKHQELLETFGERLALLAPNAEGSTWFFAALEEAARKRGDQDALRRWAPLAHREQGVEPFLPTGIESRQVGLLVQLTAAFAFALLAGTVIKSIRGFASRLPQDAPWWKRYNPFSRWERSELLGFLLATAAMIGLAFKAAVGVAILGAVTAAPLPMAMGNLGHPESRTYLAASPDGPATRLLRAFAAHKAGDLDEAERLYRQSDSPVALANLGAIALARGQKAQAEELWAQARQRHPDLDAPAYHLGLRTERERVHLARRYDLPVLLELPTEDVWHRFWRERVAPPSSPLHVAGLLDTLQPDSSSKGPFTYAAMLIDFLLLALAVLALVSPSPRTSSSARLALVGRGLHLVAPGAAPLYGASGFFVGAAAIFLGTASQILASTQGQHVTVLGNVVDINWAQMYGVALPRPELASLHGVIRLWWLIFPINAALVLALERRRDGAP